MFRTRILACVLLTAGSCAIFLLARPASQIPKESDNDAHVAPFARTRLRVDDHPSGHQLGMVKTDFDYAKYVEAQTTRNVQGITNQFVKEEDIKFLADWMKRNVLSKEFGICHGTRAGKEQVWFQQHLDWMPGTVIGTEISSTANQFANTIQWDFHHVKDEWVGQVGFVYANTLDHSYNPKLALSKWMECLDDSGVLLLEHCTAHAIDFKSDSDIFHASFGDYLALLLSIKDADVVEVLRSPVRWNQMACRIIVAVKRQSQLNIIPAGRKKEPVMKKIEHRV